VLVAGVAVGAADEAARSERGTAPPVEGAVACGARGVDVTVALAYDHNSLGTVAGAYLDLVFRDPLTLPDPPTAETLRPRLTSLMPPEHRLALPTHQPRGTLRVAVTTSEPGIPPMNAFAMRFDCPEGTRAHLAGLTCRTEQVVDGAGLPMPEAMARQVGCVVARIAPAGAS
jgi:hypothetical protein